MALVLVRPWRCGAVSPCCFPLFHSLFVCLHPSARRVSLLRGAPGPCTVFCFRGIPINLSLSLCPSAGEFHKLNCLRRPFCTALPLRPLFIINPITQTTTIDRTYTQLHFLHPPSTSLRYRLHRITSTRPTTIINNACLPPSPRHHKGVDSGIFSYPFPHPPYFETERPRRSPFANQHQPFLVFGISILAFHLDLRVY